MKTGLHQHTALRQDLRINPRLYQAMDLLYMPLLDLEQHLKQELLGNPFLEMIEPEEEVQATAAEQQQNKPEKEAKAEDEPDWESILLEDRTEHGVPSGSYSDAREYVEPVTVESKDLIDYLRDQTRMLDLNPRQQLLAEEFLGNIGEDGYLQHSIEEILKGANQLLEEHEAESELDLNVPAFTTAEVEAMLHVIQQLDPPGLAARNLRDCWLLQLESEKLDDKHHVCLEGSSLPRLRICKTYQEIARDKKKYDGKSKEFINQRLNSAHWMIQAIEQRRQTMLKVMNFIVDRQREFFEKGIDYLKPLTLREVADVISMHESTVSRVTNEKYVQTPRGLLPLKF